MVVEAQRPGLGGLRMVLEALKGSGKRVEDRKKEIRKQQEANRKAQETKAEKVLRDEPAGLQSEDDVRREAHKRIKQLRSDFHGVEQAIGSQKFPPPHTSIDRLPTSNIRWMLGDIDLNVAQENDALVGFISRMATVSQELRDDPAFLIQEAMRLRMTSEYDKAFDETNAVLHRVRQKVEELLANPEHTELHRSLSNTLIDFAIRPEMRTSMTPLSGPTPDAKDSDAVKELFRPGIPADDALDPQVIKILGGAKTQMLNTNRYIANSELDRIYESLRGLVDLTAATGSPQEKINNDVAEAMRKLDRVREDAQHQLRAAEERAGRGEVVKWTEDHKDRFQHSARKIDDVHPVYRMHLTKDDQDLIMSGEEGQKEWIVRFRRRHESVGKPFKMELAWQSEFEEARKLMEWTWGEQTLVADRLRERFDFFEEVDGLVKSIETRPKPGKPEDQTRDIRFLNNERADRLAETEWFDIAKPAFTESMDFFARQDMTEYQDTLRELMTEIPHPFDTGRRITPNDLLKELDEHIGTLTAQQHAKRKELQDKIDRIGRGVMIRDYHMLPRGTEYDALSQKMEEYNRYSYQISEIRRDSHLTPTQQAERIRDLEGLQTNLTPDIQDLWKKVTLDNDWIFDPNDPHAMDEIRGIRGLSPVQIEARERMKAALRLQGLSEDDIRKNDWKIYDALWAAHALSVGKGEAMEIGAKLIRSPVLDLKYKLKRKPTPDHFMDRGYAEAYQRILNPNLFADDFSMGDKRGEEIRNLYYMNAFKSVGYDLLKDSNVPESYKQRLREVRRSGEVPEWVVVTDYAMDVLGIPFTEVIRPEMLATGLQSLSTSWRDKRAVLNPMDREFLDKMAAGTLPAGAIPDLQGLGYRFNAEGNHDNRKRILYTMLKRKPSVFMHLIGDEMASLAEAHGVRVNGQEWRKFQRALTVAEMQTWKDPDLKYQEFDFGKREDFMRLMPEALKVVGLIPQNASVDQSDPELNKYFGFISAIRDYMDTTVPGTKDTKRIDKWADHKFQTNFILSQSDFNWQGVKFENFGMYGMERRINDLLGQARARDLLFDLLYNKPELFSPLPGKEADMIMHIKAFRDAIVSYAGYPTADPAWAAALRTVIDWNRLQSLKLAWIPGAMTVLKRSRGLDKVIHSERLGTLIPGWHHFAEEHKLLGFPIERIPRSMAELVSHDTVWSGFEGNAWDEFKVAHIITTAHQYNLADSDLGIQLLHKMESDYHASLGWRMFVAMPRKYWPWIIMVTVALAAEQSLAAETKESGGGGGGGGGGHH